MQRFRQVGRHVWAPDIAMVNGTRMAYFTLYNSKEDASIAVLRESSTPGKFEYVDVITSGKVTGIDDTTKAAWEAIGTEAEALLEQLEKAADAVSIALNSIDTALNWLTAHAMK